MNARVNSYKVTQCTHHQSIVNANNYVTQTEKLKKNSHMANFGYSTVENFEKLSSIIGFFTVSLDSSYITR